MEDLQGHMIVCDLEVICECVCVFMSGHARMLKGHVSLLCVFVGVGDLLFQPVCLSPFKTRQFFALMIAYYCKSAK